MSKIINIVCLGGGFVALFLAKSLRSAIKRQQVQLTIIDRYNYHAFHGLIPEMVAGKIQTGTPISPARRIFKPAQMVNAEIEMVDWDKKFVLISRSLDGKQFTLPFDHLVLGIGFEDNLKRYPGLSENAFRLRDYYDALKLRNHIPLMLELANIETDLDERRRLLTFVIAGGNYAGVEVATELSDFGNTLIKRDFPRIPLNEFRVVLIEGGASLLPELGSRFPKLAAYALNRIQQMKIDIKCNTFINSAAPDTAVTNTGESIPTRTIISCTGGSPNKLVSAWGFTADRIGRIVTNENLQVLSKTDIWAGGDCAAVPLSQDVYCPPLAHYAMKAGATIGKNILRQLKKQPLQAFSFTGLGEA